MIDYVHGGEYLTVHSSTGSQPYINMSNTQPMIGSVTYDSSSRKMKVFDGSSWMVLGGGQASVELSPTAISILKWAEKKMQEEIELERLSETNPTIKDLVEQVKNKQDQIKMVQNLIKKEDEWADVAVQAGP